jgi:hypothetical protein
LHSFCNGLELDRAAVSTGLTLPHRGGRAGFDLLRHLILLQRVPPTVTTDYGGEPN